MPFGFKTLDPLSEIPLPEFFIVTAENRRAIHALYLVLLTLPLLVWFTMMCWACGQFGEAMEEGEERPRVPKAADKKDQ
jgi:hypothetical protein|eukprot:SAG25_NODE_1571_length_2750_cov_19.556687_2_plen_79_part_00